MCISLESKLDTIPAGTGLLNKHTADWVIRWWICFVSIAFLLLTWIWELKSRLSVCPLSKYNYPVHSVTCTCQNHVWKARSSTTRVEESQRDVKRTDWERRGDKKGKRYANTTMTSSLREEREGCERGEQSHVETHEWEETLHQDSSSKGKKSEELRCWFRKDNIALLDCQSPQPDH